MIKTAIIDNDHALTGELLRLLVTHPDVDTIAVENPSRHGMPVSDYYPDLLGETDVTYSEQIDPEKVDVVFACLRRGEHIDYLQHNEIPKEVAVIDLSGDYRIESESHDFIYGLPELNRKRIVRFESRHVALPSAIATAVELTLLPLAKNLLLGSHIEAHVEVGTTETDVVEPAGAAPAAEGYLLLHHPDEVQAELHQSLSRLQNSFAAQVSLHVTRSQEARGIVAHVTCDSPNITGEIAHSLYNEYYDDHSFVHLVAEMPHPAHVSNTNKCYLHGDIVGGTLHITGVIDNLLKGRAGQAIHCMNLLFGLKETTGLRLKSDYYNA